MKKVLLPLLIIIGFAAPMYIGAATQGDVVINEIAWMGNTASANNEWLELKNTTNSDVNVFGWTLTSSDGKIKANLKGFIIAQGFYLMERTDDNSVPEVPADLIYVGALNNAGQDLTLQDTAKNIIDRVNFPVAWPAGNNTTKQTMEKTLTGWQTSLNPGGTPKAKNSTGVVKATAPAATAAGAPIINTTYPGGVIINELLPAPEGSDLTDEWVELHNTNDFSVDLSSWKLQDTKGTPTTYAFPKSSSIPSNGYLVLKRPVTKITLNNDADGLNLLWPNKKVADSVVYDNAIKNQSYNKAASGWQWSKTLTPGTANIVESVLPNSQKTDNTYLSAVSEPKLLDKTKTSNPWLLFLVALTSVIVAGITVVIVKIRQKAKVKTQNFK